MIQLINKYAIPFGIMSMLFAIFFAMLMSIGFPWALYPVWLFGGLGVLSILIQLAWLYIIKPIKKLIEWIKKTN